METGNKIKFLMNSCDIMLIMRSKQIMLVLI